MNKELIINEDISLLDALAIMDRISKKLLIVCANGKFLGVISIGDIQRALLNKDDLSEPVKKFIRKRITFANANDDLSSVKNRMKQERIEAMPVVDSNGTLKEIIEWDQLFTAPETLGREKIDIPVVIMAGGKGTRLLPLTNVIPKPLIPISDNTIIEEIMIRFKNVGCQKFVISVNYMNEMICDYFRNKKIWNVEFIKEKKPLGTGGSLYLLKGKINTSFFVTNCDTLIDVDLHDLLQYHRDNQNSITLISAVKSFNIPYGIIETGKNGSVKYMKEKPDVVFQINSGFYILEPEALDYIQEEEFANITDIIDRAVKDGKRVGAFPVSEKSWVDMGNWDEYLKLVNEYLKNHT